jgi:TRAP-type C4-dicarboxylate transport system permease small subunit
MPPKAKARAMRFLYTIHDGVTRASFAGAAASVAVIVLAFWYEVSSRYFLEAPTVWAYAIASYALSPMIFLAMPEMSRRGAHIAIGYLTDVLPQGYRLPLRRAICIATAAVCYVAAWIMAEETLRQYQQGIETISGLPIPKWWVSIFAPYAFLSSGLYFLRQLSGVLPDVSEEMLP